MRPDQPIREQALAWAVLTREPDFADWDGFADWLAEDAAHADAYDAIASLDTALPWRRAMQGHAVSNVIPVVGATRIGFEPWDG